MCGKGRGQSEDGEPPAHLSSHSFPVPHPLSPIPVLIPAVSWLSFASLGLRQDNGSYTCSYFTQLCLCKESGFSIFP